MNETRESFFFNFSCEFPKGWREEMDRRKEILEYDKLSQYIRGLVRADIEHNILKPPERYKPTKTEAPSNDYPDNFTNFWKARS